MHLLGYNESWYNGIPTRKRAQYRVSLRQDTGQVGLWVVDGQRWEVKPSATSTAAGSTSIAMSSELGEGWYGESRWP